MAHVTATEKTKIIDLWNQGWTKTDIEKKVKRSSPTVSRIIADYKMKQNVTKVTNLTVDTDATPVTRMTTETVTLIVCTPSQVSSVIANLR